MIWLPFSVAFLTSVLPGLSTRLATQRAWNSETHYFALPGKPKGRVSGESVQIQNSSMGRLIGQLNDDAKPTNLIG